MVGGVNELSVQLKSEVYELEAWEIAAALTYNIGRFVNPEPENRNTS